MPGASKVTVTFTAAFTSQSNILSTLTFLDAVKVCKLQWAFRTKVFSKAWAMVKHGGFNDVFNWEG